VTFRLNCEIGRDVGFEELRSKHDAVLIAIGVYRAKELTAPNATAPGVVAALDYLITSNKTGLGDSVEDYANGALNAEGKKVVVIGGGDTAMDCVRTAIRQGAKSVTCLYRRDRANMPGSQREVANAEEEGVKFDWLAAPKAIKGDAKKAKGVRAARMRLGRPDASGRQSPEDTGQDYDVPADLVIKALGFDPEDIAEGWDAGHLKTTRFGTVRVDGRMQTNLPGVFAAGDIVRGASLVVWAIKDGRDAADAIHAYLKDRAAGQTAGARFAAE
jgi:glutamate synthase (NADPH/NADH) small chain